MVSNFIIEFSHGPIYNKVGWVSGNRRAVVI